MIGRVPGNLPRHFRPDRAKAIVEYAACFGPGTYDVDAAFMQPGRLSRN
jgi:hypothetical protein